MCFDSDIVFPLSALAKAEFLLKPPILRKLRKIL